MKLRIRRKHPELTEKAASGVASDIEAALTGFFREGGLTLATTLFATKQTPHRPTIPSSMLEFFSEASAKYDDLLRRQAFITGSVDAFVEGEEAERDYLVSNFGDARYIFSFGKALSLPVCCGNRF